MFAVYCLVPHVIYSKTSFTLIKKRVKSENAKEKSHFLARTSFVYSKNIPTVSLKIVMVLIH